MSVATDRSAVPSSASAAIDLDVNLSARRIYFVLLAVVSCLAILSTLAKAVMLALPAEQYGAVHELCRRLYLDFENNIPAWFSTLGLFCGACLFGLIAYAHRERRRRDFWPWLGLSVLFIGLAIDEATFIHEILIVSLRERLNLTGIFYFAWVIPGAVFVFGIGIMYLPFVLRLPRETRNGLLLAGACYVGGALGMELFGGMLAESRGFDSLAYIAVMTLEESMEMIGIITLIFVLLRHFGGLCQTARIRVT